MVYGAVELTQVVEMLIKEPAQRQVISNILSLFVLKGIDVLVPLLVAPFLIKVVGIEKFGLIAFSLAFAAYFSAAINYGFNITASRDIARCRHDANQVAWIYSHILASVVILSFGCALAAAGVVYFFPRLYEESWLFFGAFTLVIMQSALPVWLFIGYEKMAFIGGLSAASKVLYIGSLFLLIRTEQDYVYVNIINAVSAAVVLVAALFLIRYSFGVRFVSITLSGVITSLKGGWSVFVMQLSPVLYNNSSVFVLGATFPPSVVGVYSAAMRVAEVATTGGRLLANAFLPYIAVDIDRHEAFSKFMIFVGGMVGGVIFVFSSAIAELLFSEGEELISYCLKWFSFGVFFAFLYLTYSQNYLPLVSKERVVAKMTFVVSVLGLLLLVIFIPLFGLTAAVSVFVISRFVLAILSVTFYVKSHAK